MPGATGCCASATITKMSTSTPIRMDRLWGLGARLYVLPPVLQGKVRTKWGWPLCEEIRTGGSQQSGDESMSQDRKPKVLMETRQFGGEKENLLLGYGLVALVAVTLGAVGLMEERRRKEVMELGSRPEHKGGMVVTGDDMELISKEEGLVWGANYLGVALLGPGVLALMLLMHLRTPLALLAAVPMLVVVGGGLAFLFIRRWDSWIRQRL